jgi:hypothetical protein
MGITEPHIMSWTHGQRSSTLDRGRSSMTSPGRGTHAGSRVAVGAIALASMLTPLNTSMLPVALPHVQREFGTSASASTWLLTVFALGSAVGHPLAGVLADRLGPRRVLIGGLGRRGRQCARGLGRRDVHAARRAPRRAGARHIHRLSRPASRCCESSMRERASATCSHPRGSAPWRWPAMWPRR